MSLYSIRSTVFYFNFLVELGWRASLGRFGLDWGLYFKELLGENVVTPSQNKQFSIVLRLFFNKKEYLRHNIQFSENCVSCPTTPKKRLNTSTH
jgi:hypothetical protein